MMKDSDYEFEPTDGELERYRRIQREYLLNLKSMGLEIPPDKVKMYKILIEKDYDEHPTKSDIKKKGINFLK